MIRAILLAVGLVVPAHAQDITLPDVTLIRQDPRIDLSLEIPLIIQQSIAAAEDEDYF